MPTVSLLIQTDDVSVKRNIPTLRVEVLGRELLDWVSESIPVQVALVMAKRDDATLGVNRDIMRALTTHVQVVFRMPSIHTSHDIVNTPGIRDVSR